MKKKLLAIFLSLVLCLSIVALVACDKEHVCESKCPECGKCTNAECEEEACKDKCPGHNTPSTDIPVEEGKVTIYAEIDFEFPEYASPYFLGGVLGFSEWDGNEVEMIRLGETNYYYFMIDSVDTSLNQWNDYLIVIGYNANSGLDAGKQGNNGHWWKTDQTTAADGHFFEVGENETDEDIAAKYKGEQVINLGKHTFDGNGSLITEPYVIAKTELRIVFEQELGANAQVLLMGDFNGWNAEKAAATQDSADKRIWKLQLTDILATSYTYKILVCEDTTLIANKDNSPWGDTKADGSPAYIEINYGGENITVELAKVNNNSYVDLAGTNSVEYHDEDYDLDIEGIDLSLAVDGKIDLREELSYTVTVEFTAAIPEGYKVWLIGNANLFGIDWTSSKAIELKSEDRIHWSVTFNGDSKYNGAAVEGKICVVKGETHNWDGANFGADGTTENNDNASFKISQSIDMTAIYGGALTFAAEPPIEGEGEEVDVVFTLTFAEAIAEGQYVYLAGSMEGWHGTLMTASADRKVFTAAMTVGKGNYEFKIVFTPSEMPADAENVWAVDGNKELFSSNTKIAVTAEGTVDLFEEAITLAEEVEVTFTVTFTAAIPEGLNVWIAGSIEGWKGTKMSSEDGITWTLTLTVSTGEHQFKLVVGGETFSWDDVQITPDNVTITISEAGTVELLEENPTYSPAE